MDGILCAVFNEQGQKGEAGVEQEGEDEEVDEEEDDESTTHCPLVLWKTTTRRACERVGQRNGGMRTLNERVVVIQPEVATSNSAVTVRMG